MTHSDTARLAEGLEHYFDRLWPLNRSLAGPGIRSSFRILEELIGWDYLDFPTGSSVFDWTIPPEWHVDTAYFVDPAGRRHADVAVNTLHLVGYSVPYQGTLTREELLPHLHSLPETPDAIPYVTSYYAPTWGFCLKQSEIDSLPQGDYKVVVNTELKPGYLRAGEAILRGDSEREILFSSYLCHPSMANNELSGPLTLAFLYSELAKRPNRRHTIRFVVAPETIGTIAFLSARGDWLRGHLDAGLVLTCLGHDHRLTYKESRRGNTLVDRALRVLLRESRGEIVPFSPIGSDERQYCSPGFNLPVGTLMRKPFAEFPEYHTSKDNKSSLSFERLAENVQFLATLVDVLDANVFYRSTNPNCEPQLGKRDLYRNLSKEHTLPNQVEAMFWLLNYSDGYHDLLDIAERSALPVSTFLPTIATLLESGLIERCPPHDVS